ncbi:uncharacterized protein EDB91DRAFT_18185 [Suillus paluster]|uniref:uncharacterized protein n=1 Tax=Suillus paluster TaxID=48578 RepID=UPI001B86D0A7|nr:uncharacterized protein EDB91DRAFT_18185 [Suillus paluster]KAG1756475.1 hypothetical protein EDB91DRAFT_18185 [Suillus paluster]
MPLNAISSPLDSRYHDGSFYEFGTSTATLQQHASAPCSHIHHIRPAENILLQDPLHHKFRMRTPAVASRFTPPTPSVIRDSLKDLFSHARHEPGDMSQKSGPRSNSFGVSEIVIATVVTRARVRYKGKGQVSVMMINPNSCLNFGCPVLFYSRLSIKDLRFKNRRCYPLPLRDNYHWKVPHLRIVLRHRHARQMSLPCKIASPIRTTPK